MQWSTAILLVAALGAAPGCIHRELRVDSGELFAQVPQLRRTGRADVGLEGGGRSTLVLEQSVGAESGHASARLTIAALIDHCPDVAPFREDRFQPAVPCRLQDVDDVFLGTRREPNWNAWKVATAGTAIVGAISGLAACATTCSGTPRAGSDVALAGLGSLTLLLTMSLSGLGR